jgi:hypothetical protein
MNGIAERADRGIMHRSPRRPKTKRPVPVRRKRQGVTAARGPEKIFISYRRNDSEPYARHLFESLALRFGEESVFLDQSTIEPGAEFPRLIRDTIAGSGVMMVVIGPRWAGAGDGLRKPRIMDTRDWVRREIELGLRARLHLMPVLVDGAMMPKTNELPDSLRPLARLNAVNLPWHETIEELAKAISKGTESGGRYDLTRHLRERTKAQPERAIVLTAMELSLARQGERVVLDDSDLDKKFLRATKRPLKDGVQMNEIMYVVDRVGIAGRTARGARRTYSARAFRLGSLAQIPLELAKGRPIITGLAVTKKWFSKKVSRSGLIEAWKDPGYIQGGILSVIVGFQPADGSIQFLTRWPTWGDRGIGTMTAGAMRRANLDPRQMFSVEAAEAVTLNG